VGYAINNYISLKEAVEYCNYSQEYLSLRARQGKLKAMKIGRNWVTKKEWLENYLGRTEGYNEYCKEHLKIETIPSFSPSFVVAPDEKVETDTIGEEGVYETLSEHEEKKEFVYKLPFGEYLSLSVGKRTPIIRLALVSSLVLAIVIGGIVFVKKPMVDKGINRQIVSAGSTLKGAGEVFNEYVNWLEQKFHSFASNFKKIPGKIAGSYKLLTTQKKEESFSKDEIALPQSEKTGMVVIPSTGKDEEIKEKIELSFSDEVRVKSTDKSSGVIIPIFREGEGEEYMYILVPIKN
jgi:hypothetical protein